MKSILIGICRGLLVGSLICPCGMVDARGATADSAMARNVVDMPASELLQTYRKELAYLDAAVPREGLDALLARTGETVAAFFRDFSNVSAKERVLMQRNESSNIFVDPKSAATGMSLPGIINEPWSKSATKVFNYIILARSAKSGFYFAEYRTDKSHRAINPTAEAGSFIVSSGYAGLCLYLHPRHQVHARFRYVGREKRAPRAHVIAFAQKPESGDYLAQYLDVGASNSIRLLVQGFAWVEPDTGQILRMRTSMLTADKPTALKEQITDVRYTKVAFDNARRHFWLPREANVSWKLPGVIYRNRHTYSDYHWFTVESTVKFGMIHPFPGMPGRNCLKDASGRLQVTRDNRMRRPDSVEPRFNLPGALGL